MGNIEDDDVSTPGGRPASDNTGPTGSIGARPPGPGFFDDDRPRANLGDPFLDNYRLSMRALNEAVTRALDRLRAGMSALDLAELEGAERLKADQRVLKSVMDELDARVKPRDKWPGHYGDIEHARNAYREAAKLAGGPFTQNTVRQVDWQLVRAKGYLDSLGR